MIQLDWDDLLRVSLGGWGYQSAMKEHSWDCVVDAYQSHTPRYCVDRTTSGRPSRLLHYLAKLPG
jgi:hypothetical protein